MRYKQALQAEKQKLNNSDFKRLCGVSKETFEKMSNEIIKAKLGRQGCHSKLSIPDQILLTLQYWREYRTLFHISQDWNIHESTACRIVKRIVDAKRLLSVNILIKVEEFHLPSKRKLQQNETDIEVIVIDVGEIEIERPKKNRKVTIVGSKDTILLKCN